MKVHGTTVAPLHPFDPESFPDRTGPQVDQPALMCVAHHRFVTIFDAVAGVDLAVCQHQGEIVGTGAAGFSVRVVDPAGEATRALDVIGEGAFNPCQRLFPQLRGRVAVN